MTADFLTPGQYSYKKVGETLHTTRSMLWPQFAMQALTGVVGPRFRERGDRMGLEMGP